MATEPVVEQQMTKRERGTQMEIKGQTSHYRNVFINKTNTTMAVQTRTHVVEPMVLVLPCFNFMTDWASVQVTGLV